MNEDACPPSAERRALRRKVSPGDADHEAHVERSSRSGRLTTRASIGGRGNAFGSMRLRRWHPHIETQCARAPVARSGGVRPATGGTEREHRNERAWILAATGWRPVRQLQPWRRRRRCARPQARGGDVARAEGVRGRGRGGDRSSGCGRGVDFGSRPNRDKPEGVGQEDTPSSQ